jgi:hypothetical protein
MKNNFKIEIRKINKYIYENKKEQSIKYENKDK